MINKCLFFSFLIFQINESQNTNETVLVEMFGDEGDDLILPCVNNNNKVKWMRPGKISSEKSYILNNGSLSMTDISHEDMGIYTCMGADIDTVLREIKLNVRTTPPALVNVSVAPRTILATLRWGVEDTGGYPITHFTAQYRLRHTPPNQLPDIWHPVIPGRISPSFTQIDVFKLEPNSSYVFQIWANNKLGRGSVVEVEAITLHDLQEIELGRHLLEGAQTFDTRVWVAAVAVVMGTLVVLATLTLYALYKECHIPLSHGDDQETLELIPNIILNPGYHEDLPAEWLEPDENSNDRTSVRLNNNVVVNPTRI